MVVTCKRCAATFKVDTSKPETDGHQVKCVKCGLVFSTKKIPHAPADEAVMSSLADQLMMLSDSPAGTVDASPLAPSPPAPGEAIPAPEPVRTAETTAAPKRRSAPTPQTPIKRTRPTPVPSPPKSETLSHRPFAGPPVPLKQRLFRAFFVALVVVMGVLFGLIAMGIKPLPKDLFLLVKYGRRALPEEIQILAYRGRIQEISPTERALRVAGEIFNNLKQNLPPPVLRLEVFSPNGEFLWKKSFPCCSERLRAGDIVPFSVQIDLGPTASVGSYKVSIEE